MDFRTWEDPDPAEVLVLTSSADWDALLGRYTGGYRDEPLARCLEVARSGRALSVVIETRYIDLDYRSEYAAFYARTFGYQPDSTHRLHFFRAPIDPDQIWELPSDHGYLGYVIIRPSRLGPVGRTMLAPPPGLEDAVRTARTETVHFFGQQIPVTAVPFMQQDQQLDRCAHAAAWICHYSAHRAGLVGRRPMASFSLMADPSLGANRAIPSEGLTAAQLVELFRVFELPARLYDVRSLPSVRPSPPNARPTVEQPVVDGVPQHPGLWDARLISICCRYLNSGIPVLVGTREHAFVLCGYRRRPQEGGGDWIEFIRQDDQLGPYLTVENVFDDVAAGNGYRYSPWQVLIAPMPEKLWLPPEPAEGLGARLLDGWAKNIRDQVPDASALLKAQDRGEVAYRTYALSSNDFKAGLADRVAPELVRAYRLARLPRFVWVVEAVSRPARTKGDEKCVLGEVIFDSTSSELAPEALAIHVPGVAALVHMPAGKLEILRCDPAPYRSGGVGSP